jgi:membrane fusion protein, copper/silver efflux system
MKKVSILKNKSFWMGIGFLVVGVLLGWLIFGGGESTVSPMGSTGVIVDDHEHEAGSVWTCSMHPQIRMEESGSCPICGMDLIPLEVDDEGDDGPTGVFMSARAMKIAEVELSVIEVASPFNELYLPGKIKPDETRIALLTARFPGRIEDLRINFTGQEVRKGEVLASIYSPELVTAQKELFEAIKLKENYPELYEAAKMKLSLWDLTAEQISDIETTGEIQYNFDILAPIAGTVTMRHVSKGDYVKEGSMLLEVVDLTRIWVVFDAYESDLPWIKLGDKVTFTVKSMPGTEFNGKISFIDPIIDPKARVAKVRAELKNPRNMLKPDMFVKGILKAMLEKTNEAIMVPKTAVLWTGKKAVVYVRVPDGDRDMFDYREITLGEEAGDYYVVRDGLSEGERVATNGVFKIDAAAQLLGKQSMMNPSGGKVSLTHDHGAMEEDGKEEEEPVDHSNMEGMEPVTVDEVFKEQLTAVFNQYLLMKDAFVGTDAAMVKSEAQKMASSLEKVNMGLLKGDAHLMWMDILAKINEPLNTIKASSEIEAQRALLGSLSDALYEGIKTFSITGLNAFYQFCPMANDSKGAYWLSVTEDIKNPFYGEAMLTCGETKETIK